MFECLYRSNCVCEIHENPSEQPRAGAGCKHGGLRPQDRAQGGTHGKGAVKGRRGLERSQGGHNYIKELHGNAACSCLSFCCWGRNLGAGRCSSVWIILVESSLSACRFLFFWASSVHHVSEQAWAVCHFDQGSRNVPKGVENCAKIVIRLCVLVENIKGVRRNSAASRHFFFNIEQ